jgi:membrane fusion protein, multidrug efflux system
MFRPLTQRPEWAHRIDRTAAIAIMGLALATATGCSKQKQTQAFARPAMPVETIVIVPQSVVDRFEAVGTIEAREAITVVSEIDGTVISLPFREGAPIAKGGLIAQLDDVQLKAEVDRAEALKARAEAHYGRVKPVVDQGAGSQQDLDDAGADLKVAEANLALARARLAKTRIVAPFDGIAGARRLSPGAFARAGTPITDLAQISELRVNFSAPERYLSQLSPGAAVKVSTTAYPGYEIDGEISVVEPVLDSATRSTRVIVRLPNPGGRFRPGMSANVTAVLSERPNALTVPSEAVFEEGSQTFVYVVKTDSTVTRTALTLGTRLRDGVEVLHGLESGMRVVRAGHQKLYEGAKVLPIASQAAPGQAAGPVSGGATETHRDRTAAVAQAQNEPSAEAARK